MANLQMGTLAKELAKTRFRSFNLTLPTVVGTSSPPLRAIAPALLQGRLAASTPIAGAATRPVIGAQRVGAAPAPAPAPAPAATPMSMPPALFRAASNAKGDVDFQKAMHDLYNGLFDGVIDALEHGFNLYRVQAGLVDVMINGPIATGGRIQGPAIDGLMNTAPAVAAWSGWEANARNAVAKGFQKQWEAYARGPIVPGLPWYPGFAAFPGPQAPPMPNVPTPMIMLASPGLAQLQPTALKAAMRAALQGEMDYCMEFFDAISGVLSGQLQIWLAQQMVMGAMGQGPIPTFAPPYVPVGPVVGGSILPGRHFNS